MNGPPGTKPAPAGTGAGGTRYAALLRAVNLGPHNKVGMGALRDLATQLGLAYPRTLVQSGNLVFAAGTRSPGALERLLEGALKEQLGLDTTVLVRSAAEWMTIVAGNPFVEQAGSDPSHLVVMVLRDDPAGEALSTLREAMKGAEAIRPGGRHLYLYYPDGIGRSKLTTTLIEQKLSTRGTARNWNTVLKLAALLQD